MLLYYLRTCTRHRAADRASRLADAAMQICHARTAIVAPQVVKFGLTLTLIT